MQTTLKCPKCGQMDQVQKVKGLVSNNSTTPLAQRLNEPREPSEPSHPLGPDDTFEWGTMFGWLVGLAVVAGLTAAVLNLFAHWTNVSGICGAYIGIVIAIVLVSLVISQGRRERRAVWEKDAFPQWQKEVDEWERGEHALWEKMKNLWENDLYYCNRCDKVFLEGSNDSKPPEQMDLYLAQHV